ncbi:hypothetical protein [Dokdonia sp. 4H-3-7-5]|uniref:hypothetical protein n=1 Tax=Dokdonia sp. (strain 4H-3-7-5) TaxID=983548 RepID=UPI00020A6B86|nr:hypothetical protein [Dokdonia sp. 4H-3-7-5]AEE18505.1 hypothetical protein Krodi_0520 [Dokdonia sp. 4H-3-7-5]
MKKHLLIIFTLLVSLQSFSQRKYQKSEYSKYLEQHPFGSISDNYVLILSGYFDDCGEFGGHEETIELTRIDKKLTAIITVFDNNCSGNTAAKLDAQSYLVKEATVPLFQDYLNQLLTKSFAYYIPYHAGNTYKATLDFKKTNDNKEDDDTFKRVHLVYPSVGSKWPAFEKLKHNIINQ